MTVLPSIPHCAPAGFQYPIISGAQFLHMQASLVQNYSRTVPEQANANHGAIQGQDMSFCNITLTHTHPGQNDTVTTQIWLPIKPAWNERLKAVGGGGWVAGLDLVSSMTMSAAVAEGYASVTTNGGVTPFPGDWALLSPGNVDLYSLQNFASVALHDGALAAKSVIQDFYGTPPLYSYWSGCSQGGRQGLLFAQEFPDMFDGIAAAAPAINFPDLFVGSYHPQQVMNELESYPHACEIDALTTAAIRFCDGSDGLIDGIISDPDSCCFDPFSLVGAALSCDSPSAPATISQAAATVVDAAWSGLRTSNGSLLWPGLNYQANLTGPSSIVGTSCLTNQTCQGLPSPLITPWMRLFVAKDPEYNINNMTRRDYEEIFRRSAREYNGFIGTNSPDLRAFREAGGKIITYHGLADEIIPFDNSRRYYETVASLDPQVHDFFRLFPAPALGHCYGGIGGYPSGTFDALVDWVERGIAPESLRARSPTGKTTLLCPYPKKSKFRRPSLSDGAEAFVCA
ncbi:feruloyl esterase b precursor [Stagonosporopsis vannaccii]|nr:feruloyl esterase b precursor [Stagonosporopsis vannaccii]